MQLQKTVLFPFLKKEKISLLNIFAEFFTKMETLIHRAIHTA